MSVLLVWDKIFRYHFWLERSSYSRLLGKTYQCTKETFYGRTEILKLWLLPEIWLKISTFFKDRSYHCKANKFEPLIISGITLCCLYLSFLFFPHLTMKISWVIKWSSTEESALLLYLKELHWELYYAHLKSKISNYKQLTGQLNVVKSFTGNTLTILKCFNL